MSKHTNVSRRMLFKRDGVTRVWSCLRKHAHTREKAIRLAAERSEDTGHKLHAYPCLFCPSWHIGHDRRRFK